MSFSINRVALAGVLADDPETVSTDPLTVRMTLLVTEKWPDRRNGGSRSRTDTLRVSIYNEHLATLALKAARKGSNVYLEGALQNRFIQGGERSVTEVVLNQFKSTLKLLDDDREQPSPVQQADAAA